MKNLLLGGDVYNERTLPRFFILHGAVLPCVIVFLVFVHITLIRLQGISPLRFEGEGGGEADTFNFFPDHFYTELVLGLFLMILLTALSVIFPAGLGEKADPLTTPDIIKPEWYFFATFRWLKLFSGTVAILTMGCVVFLMFAWPFIDGWIRRKYPASEFSVWIGMIAVFVLIGLTVWEALVAH